MARACSDGSPAPRALSHVKPLKQYLGADSVLQTILTGEVAPLHGTFIMKLFESGKPLVRRQELPEEAFFSYDDLLLIREGLHENRIGTNDDYGRIMGEADADTEFMEIFHTLSYRWLDKVHPDKELFHLNFHRHPPAAEGLAQRQSHRHPARRCIFQSVV